MRVKIYAFPDEYAVNITGKFSGAELQLMNMVFKSSFIINPLIHSYAFSLIQDRTNPSEQIRPLR